MVKQNNNKGFGLIELLVVIAIIALLSTIAIVSLNGAKEKARDAKRIADTKQIRTALDMYFNEKELFPIITEIITLGGGDAVCLDKNGFAISCEEPIYMKPIYPAPFPPLNNKYTYISTNSGNDYQLSFTLEKPNINLGVGINCIATKDKVECKE
ncbi:hypothetical protein CVV26_03435 [Candidatus Kuenenbacteria bacterium HGW-Kuenenbacteria-1]|uniref:Type II secretion system protein GspG C-terminal domain-containing protein n=1 Tax=Candidatus Kuenenbacteria bacterium HGW-Kuenenbacteria-1 TaxID=2013812 RepID=A0A2N1UMN6_9BACT|nr:MAG: hypothetical protein CVV26_03435 [Candidatus Kuenenbacteria bacterium HGW-Kuenenbacteria-1]